MVCEEKNGQLVRRIYLAWYPTTSTSRDQMSGKILAALTYTSTSGDLFLILFPLQSTTGCSRQVTRELAFDVSESMSRRQRRANAAATPLDETASIIPLASPDYSAIRNSKSKTLYEIAAERQAQLVPHATTSIRPPKSAEDVKYVKIAADGTIQETTAEGGMETDEADTGEVAPIFDTLFLASSLSALHCTLEVLTVHQYAQELRFPPIIKNTLFVAFPTLTFAIHLFHGHLLPDAFHRLPSNILNGVKSLQQLLFLVAANVAGCYLIYLTNDKGYYAIMKRAPSIGTFWVWCVLELGLAGALAGVVGPGIYAWYNEYGIF